MAELLQTERAYVKDLETCITCYLREMRTDPSAVPAALQGKVTFHCTSPGVSNSPEKPASFVAEDGLLFIYCFYY